MIKNNNTTCIVFLLSSFLFFASAFRFPPLLCCCQEKLRVTPVMATGVCVPVFTERRDIKMKLSRSARKRHFDLNQYSDPRWKCQSIFKCSLYLLRLLISREEKKKKKVLMRDIDRFLVDN